MPAHRQAAWTGAAIFSSGRGPAKKIAHGFPHERCFQSNSGAAAPLQKRVDDVGLQQALGELQQVANPGLTTRPTGAPVAAVRQTDNVTGAVLSEDLVTPQDVPRVKPIDGATAELVPAGDPVARRRAAAQTVNTVNAEPAKKAKPPRLGKRPVPELVEMANTTKDDVEYNAAEDELYRRWVDFGDEQAENYFLDDVRPAKKGGSRATAFSNSAHGKELQARYEAALEAKSTRAAQKLGKKFGASLREPTEDIYDGMQVREGTTAKQRSIGRRAFDSLRKFIRLADADRPTGGRVSQGNSEVSDEGLAARKDPGLDDDDRRAGVERAGASGLRRQPSAEERLIPRRLRGQINVLAHRLAVDFQAGKSAALVGQRIESPEDLATLAQVYRNPHFETFRVIYLDASGAVVGEAGYSSRLPGSTETPPALGDRIAADKKRYGAARFSETLDSRLPGMSDEQRATVKREVEATVGRSEDGVEDLRAAKTLYNHMVKLQQATYAEDGVPSKVVDLLGQVGYVWYLGFTPAFWTMNLMQNPLIGIPHLGSRYGVARTVREMGRAVRWFANVRIGKLLADRKEPFSIEWLRKQNLDGITKKELDMLQELEDKQALDFTQARDLGRIGENSNSKWTWAMRTAAAGAHHTEVFNRVTLALAAYRLALKSASSVTHDQAVARALDAVRNVHFDYTSENKPLVMRGKYKRLIFQFQQYRQHMLAWWGATIKDAVRGASPEERRRAYKAAFLMGATHAVFAGALGMPFVGTIGLLANMFAPDDDDGVPFDFERWVNEAALEATGSERAAQVLTKGIFTALNMDIGQRIGQADLLPLLNEGAWRYERNTDDKMKSMLVDLLGPLGSIAVNAAGSVDSFARGDVLGGLAAATPKALSDLAKAAGLYAHGVQNSRGETLVAAEALDGSDIFMQAVGVNPASVARMKANRGAVYEIESALKDRGARLRSDFVAAWARGDREGMREIVGEIQEYNRKVAAGRLRKVPGAVIDGRSLEAAVRRARQRAMILALTGGTADTKRRLAIAMSMSGLVDPTMPQSMDDMALPGLPG